MTLQPIKLEKSIKPQRERFKTAGKDCNPQEYVENRSERDSEPQGQIAQETAANDVRTAARDAKPQLKKRNE